MKLFFRKCLIVCCCCLLPAPGLWAQPQKLYLNPATAGAAPQSKFIEITRFRPVDETAGKISAFAMLIVTAKYWILYEYADKKLYFLTKEAKFIKKIDLKKYGEPMILYDDKNECLKFNTRNKNYLLTNDDLLQIRANYAERSSRKYFKNYEIDLKDDGLQVKKTATDPYFIANARWYYDDYYYRSDLNIDPKAKDTLGYELEILQDYKPVRSFFPFNKTSNSISRYAAMNGTQVYLSGTDSPAVAFTARPFHPVIYRLDKDSIQPLYEVVLPAENAIPAAVMKNGFRSKADWENFQNNNGAAFFSINGIRRTNNYLFFGIRFMRSYESFLYDKTAAKFYKTKMIKADSSQYDIHLLQNGLGQYSKGHYYSIVPASGFVDFYNKNKEKLISYPAELEQYIRSATKNSNPVIVEYKLKD
jgi:hypothetical protein